MEAIPWVTEWVTYDLELEGCIGDLLEGTVKGRHFWQRKEQLQRPKRIWSVREVTASVGHRVYVGERERDRA